jgi:FkbH-like protein
MSRFQLLRDKFPQRQCRIALVRSFTVEPAIPLLCAAAALDGIDVRVQIGGFNTYVQDILNEESSLYRFNPDLVIVAVQTRDLFPGLWTSYADQSAEDVRIAIDATLENIEGWVRVFRSRSKAHLLIHSFELPERASQGLLDGCSEFGQTAAIQSINQKLLRIAADQSGVYVLDYDALVARQGRARWHDEKKWLTVRMPIAAHQLVHLANEWLRFVYPIVGKSCKALVTDLDNTLWGGVVGEDGIEGIQLGAEYPGAAFQALQRVMLDFYQRGILLAVCSKNNPSDAMEAIEKHPGMLLKPEHFAALRINWRDKAENLREIAAELNIGIDSVAFLDDSPIERERIRGAFPEVTVIELPEDPMDFARVVREMPAFERLTLTDEDRERGRYYAEQRKRVELERSASSLEDFYRSLRQEIEIASVTQGTLSRIAQLTQKTNQFNLTTRRYTEQQIAEMMEHPAWKIYSIRVKDRFGDNGIVGVAISRDIEKICEIDTFLLSCRVIGRTVESALIFFMVEQARARQMRQLQGAFCATGKNTMVKDFYPLHGFQKLSGDGVQSLWVLDLRKHTARCPEWIKLVSSEAATA